jgi:ubiquinone/menaquinone biosynthesis C-methylase UbiE
MAEQTIRFDDGAAYEQYMGIWSQEAGAQFLDWLRPPLQQAWLDIGCGNGAFSQLILQRCNPVFLEGVDPSPEQIQFAQSRFPQANIRFLLGDSMALPLPEASADYAVMALVIFFLTDPARGVAEMARVLKPGGVASAYAWDIEGGGFPWVAIQDGIRDAGLTPAMPPSVHVADLSVLHKLWRDAGFVEVQTRTLQVERSFSDFEAYWHIGMLGPSIRSRTDAMDANKLQALKEAVHARLGGTQGPFTITARAHAVKGVKLG